MIYLIKSGQFSDTEIHGYFTSEEDAYTYCAMVNRGMVHDAFTRGWGKVYVESVQEITTSLPKHLHQMVYEYHAEFAECLTDDTESLHWSMTYFCEEPNAYLWISKNMEQEKFQYELYKTYTQRKCDMKIRLDHPDAEKAKQIAQEYFDTVVSKDIEEGAKYWDGSESETVALRPGDLAMFTVQFTCSNVKRVPNAYDSRIVRQDLLPFSTVTDDERNTLVHISVVQVPAPYNVYNVYVYLDTHDPEKVLRIAQDYFYQVVAKQEGISL